ncbi:MAG: ankyrin repeat domain-containing protein, partial [Alphaproteobacteria bacterium]|nr:ankyrin repeat domain-containing protein [Alphaproteobacteria bacterium]
MLELMNLPFAENALSPTISEQTVKFHYDKHHRAYVDKVNELIVGSVFQDMPVEDIILHTVDRPAHVVLYNNAGQVYNHNVYWNSIGFWDKLDDATKAEIMATFKGKDLLMEKLVDEAMKVFGSGWVWLVRDAQSNYRVISTKNGDTPLTVACKNGNEEIIKFLVEHGAD